MEKTLTICTDLMISVVLSGLDRRLLLSLMPVRAASATAMLPIAGSEVMPAATE